MYASFFIKNPFLKGLNIYMYICIYVHTYTYYIYIQFKYLSYVLTYIYSKNSFDLDVWPSSTNKLIHMKLVSVSSDRQVIA